MPNDSHLILKRLKTEAEYFQLDGLKREVDFAFNTYPFAVGDTIRLRPDVVGRWINNVVDKTNPTQFLYACGLENTVELESGISAWNPFRKKSPTELFWSLFSHKRSPAEVYAWRGRITDFVERPNPDYAVATFRLPQYSKKKEDPIYVDVDLRVQIGMMVKVK